MNFSTQKIHGFLFMVLLFCSSLAFSQGVSNAVSISPANATGTDTLTITFDGRLACEYGTAQSLIGEPVVRIHSGVTVNGSSWQYFVGFWENGRNGQPTTLTYNGDSTWSITMVPDEFYGVYGAAQIEALDFVLNNNTWNKTGKDYDYPGNCIDFHIPLNSSTQWDAEWLQLNAYNSNPERIVRHISYTEQGKVWGVSTMAGSGNTAYPGIIRSPNGGLWVYEEVLYDYPGYTSTMIASAGVDSAWIIAYNVSLGDGAIFHTNNGGYSWSEQNPAAFNMGLGGFPNNIHFYDHNEGIVFGDPSGGYWEVQKTYDGGNTWTRISSSNLPAPLSNEWGIVREADFSGNTIWFTSNKSRLYISNDRGNTWSFVTTPIPSGDIATPVMKDNMTGWLYSNSNIYQTTDGGTSWIQVAWSGDFRNGADFEYVPGTQATLVSAGGQYGSSYSTDGGQTWQELTANSTNGIYSLAFLDENRGWAGGRTDSLQVNHLYKLITPNTPPVIDIYPATNQTCTGEYVEFTAHVIGWYSDINWTFNDNGTVFHRNGNTANVYFNHPGSKDVSVEVTAPSNLYGFSFENEILIREKPQVDLGPDTSTCIGNCLTVGTEVSSAGLFFSEYIEGNNLNRALEIYNPGDTTVDMHQYGIRKNYNGSYWDGLYRFPSGTTLDSGEVLVIAHAQADQAILAEADIILNNNDYNYMMGFTGDDVRALVKFENNDTLIVDIIGDENLGDPGWSWKVGDDWGGTNNRTLVRKSFIESGQTDWNLSRGHDSATSEWLVYPTDDFSHIGQHTNTPYYSYSWSNGDSTAFTDICPVSQWHPASANVSVQNAWGCSGYDDISVSGGELGVTIISPDTICTGACVQIYTNIQGGSYIWSTGDTTPQIEVCGNLNNSYEYYYVTVTDSSGCTGNASKYIVLTELDVEINGPDTICYGQTGTLSPGTGYASYIWSTGDTTPSITVSSNGFYYVTVTDSTGCTGEDYHRVYSTALNVNISGNTSVCSGQCTDLTASPAGANYLWSNGDTTQTTTVCPTTISRRYYVTVTDNSGCWGTDWIYVNVSEIDVSITGPDSVCTGGCATLSAQTLAPGYSYIWSSGDTTQSIVRCYSKAFDHLYVTVTDVNGCIGYEDFWLDVYDIPVEITSSTDSICGSQPAILSAPGFAHYEWSTGDTTPTTEAWHSYSGSKTYYLTVSDQQGCVGEDNIYLYHIDPPNTNIFGNLSIYPGSCTQLTASGGNEYLWSTGDNTASINVCPTTTTTYELQSWFVNGSSCRDTNWVTVTVNSGPLLTISNDTTICAGECVTLRADGDGTFLWSNGIGGKEITVCPSQTSTYSVTHYHVNGDTLTASVTVSISDVYANIYGDLTLCEGECTNLTATGGISYAWSNGASTSNIAACPTTTTLYTVTATNDYGCTAETSVQANVYAVPVADAGPNDTIFGSGCVTLTANGGTNYLWSTGQTNASIQVCPTQTTTYYVTVSNAEGCEDYDSVKVTFIPAPQISTSPDSTICPGICITLGATGNGTFEWSTGSTNFFTNVCPQTNTTYTVTLTDQYGQEATASIAVTVHNVTQASITGPTQICEGECVTLNAAGNGSYAWASGETTSSITDCPLAASTYYLTVTDSNGCASSTDYYLDVHPLPQADAGSDTAVCDGDCVTLTASGGGTYQWSGGTQQGASSTVCPAQTTDYTVTVTNYFGCTASNSVTVGTWPSPQLSISQDILIQPGQCTDLTVSGGDSYLWSTGATSSQINVCPANSTTYTVTASSSNGCTTSASVTVSIDNPNLGFSLKAFLQGAWLGNGFMRTNRAALADFPLAQPYNIAPWNYLGSECLDTIPQDVVDWILLEVRDGSDPTYLLTRKALLLWKDGSVTDESGNSNLMIPGASSGNYYVLLDHFSHIPVMTASPVSLSGGTLLDFSDPSVTPAYTGSYPPQANLGNGIMGMIVGDLNSDKQVKYSGVGNDRSLIFVRLLQETGSAAINATVNGYFPEDLSMDGIVKYSGAGNDPSKIIMNLITLTGSSAITSVYYSDIPDGEDKFNCGDMLTDYRDGKQYPTVIIGDQCWMAENLNFGTMVNSIAANRHSDQTDNCVIEKYCYDNDPANCDIYGGLYEWHEAMRYDSEEGAQGICPQGWHIPTDAEWNTMEANVDSQYDLGNYNWMTYTWRGSDVGGRLKSTGTAYWNVPNTGATNSSGFNALPAGYRYYTGIFDVESQYAFYWTSTPYGVTGTDAFRRGLKYNLTTSWRERSDVEFGFSLRCVSNTVPCTPQPEQANAGPDSLNITADSIQLWANQSAVGSGQWTVGSGSGAVISDSSMANAWFYGVAGETYTLVWTISTVCGSLSDTVIISFDQDVWACGDTMTDPRDGRKYATTQIGDQCWMGQSLNYGQMIPLTTNQSDNGIPERHCYNNDTNACLIYGSYYNWNEAMNYSDTAKSQGLCPPGWYIPTDAEWTQLEGTVDSQFGVNDSEWDAIGWRGSDAGYRLKSQTDWANNGSGSDLYHFNAKPNGFRASNSSIYSHGSEVYYWTSDINGSNAWERRLQYSRDKSYRWNEGQYYGFSIRCIYDSTNTCTPQPEQANAGPDSLNIAADSIQLWANQPSVGSGQWAVVSGSGAVISDSSAANSWFYGAAGDTFELVWTISNPCGSTSDTVMISFAPATTTFTCGDSLLDTRDGQNYATVQIGSQCWMAENLNVGVMVNSVNTSSSHSDVSNNGAVEKYCYNNTASNCDEYGGLYDWDEAMGYSDTEGVQGICPPASGWHIPTDAEWTQLENYLGGSSIAGGKLKESGTAHWRTPNNGATNSSGFTALPGGYRYNHGDFNPPGQNAHFWSSSASSTTGAWYRYLYYTSQNIYRLSGDRTYGFSVRCVRDSVVCTPQPEQANAGPDSLNIEADSVQLWANQSSVGSGQWAVGSGSGAVISDSSAADTWFYGDPGVTYELVWMLYTVCDTTYDTVLVSFAAPAFVNCGDEFTDPRDQQVYNTVQIGDHCWFAENLNYGTQVNAAVVMSDNGIAEKHCYNDDSTYCDTMGGLYQWDEAMAYTTTIGSQGLCPDGWHISSDYEWKNLEGSVDSQYGVGDTTWNIVGWRGFDAGKNLKSSSGWYNNGNGVDAFGFTALPAGRTNGGSSFSLTYMTYFWISQEADSSLAWSRYLRADLDGIRTGYFYKTDGRSVRCVQDHDICYPQPEQADAGPDSLNIAKDSVQLWANQSAVGSGQWAVGSGSGAVISDSSMANTWFSGDAGATYELVWMLYTVCDTTYDTVLIRFTAPQSFTQCGDSLIDVRDGQVYPTIEIGNQCWLAANLNIGIMLSDPGIYQSNNSTIEKYCYDGNAANCAQYGGLYQWNEMMDYTNSKGTQGICPSGWVLPSDADWTTLSDYLGGAYFAGGKMKETGTQYWNSPNSGATNSSGFSARGGGYASFNQGYLNQNGLAYFWSSSLNGVSAKARYLYYNRGDIGVGQSDTGMAFSVRCLLVCTPQPEQANAGPDSLNITADSIQLWANQSSVGSGQWAVGSGSGAVISDSSAADTWFYGVAGETYSLVWTISTVCGSSSDTVVIGFAPNVWECGEPITDPRDNRTYATTHIGSQCWMAQGLNYGQLIDLSINQTDNGIPERHCYNNDTSECLIYGSFYNWNEVMDYTSNEGSQGLCPPGWHIPSDAEYTMLEGNADSQYDVGDSEWNGSGFRGYDVGYHLKSQSDWEDYWNGPGTGSDKYGFNAKPNGYRSTNGGIVAHGYEAYYWTSSFTSASSWERRLYSNNWGSFKTAEGHYWGFSVRCLHDSTFNCGPAPDIANAGPDQLNLPGYNAQLNANAPAAGNAQWAVASPHYCFFSDSLDPQSQFTGIANVEHVLVWSISTLCGINTDTVRISFTGEFPNCGTITDSRDGQSYRTVIIGNQCWMRDNLNIGTRINGDLTQTNNGIIEKYCYNDIDTMCDTYGGLYQWDEMMDHLGYNNAPGICPAGWHIPSRFEQDTLIQNVYENANSIKAVGEGIPPLGLGTDSAGFSTLLAGERSSGGGFNYLGELTTYYTRSTPSGWPARTSIGYTDAFFSGGASSPSHGYPVRCLRDVPPCNPQPDQANAGPDQTTFSTSVTLSANTPVNGNGKWSILSGSGGSFSSTSDPQSSFSGTTGTTYILQWMIYNQCDSTYDHVNITFQASSQNLDVIAGDANSICAGDNYQINVTASGGQPPYTYQWEDGSTNTDRTVSPTTTTTYSATVTDGAGNTDSDNVTITVYQNPLANAGADEEICQGETVSLSASASGGTAPYSYQWSNSVSGLNQNINPSTTTTYTLTVEDDNGCIGTDEVLVTVNPNPTANAGPDQAICLGNGVALYATGSGGAAPYTYEWNNGPQSQSQTVTPGATTVYYVSVQDTNGCMGSDDVQITVNPNPTANAGSDVTINPGNSHTLNGSGTGGTPPYSYSWSNGTNSVSTTVSPLSTTTYTLSISDDNSCTDTDDVTVSVSQTSTPLTLTVSPDITLCTGESTTLNAYASDGTPPYTYTWSNMGSGSSVSVSPTSTTMYTVTASDNNGSSAMASVTVTVNPGPTANAGPDQEVCRGFTALIGEPATGGVPPYTYDWSISPNVHTYSTVTYAVNSSLTYSVTVTDAIGCTDTDEVYLEPVDQPTSNAGPSAQGVCPPHTLGASPPTNGNGIWAITDGEGGTISDPSDPTATLNGVGGETYLLEWTVTNDCGSATDIMSVSFLSMPLVEAGENQEELCDTAYLNANDPAPETGVWHIIAGIGGIIIDTNDPSSLFLGQAGQLYILTWNVRNTCGAFVSDTVQLDYLPLPTQANAGFDQLDVGEKETILDGNNPLIGKGRWEIVAGGLGVVHNPGAANSPFTGMIDSTYFIEWSIRNKCAVTSDTVVIKTGYTSIPCPGEAKISDASKNQYGTVLIGSQCWMTSNLNLGFMILHDYGGIDTNGWQSASWGTEKWCIDNNAANCDIYGGLYQWHEAMNYSTEEKSQGLCPSGWHIPSQGEFDTLNQTLKEGLIYPAGRMRDTGTIQQGTGLWESPNLNATNLSGFSALPGGKCIGLTSAGRGFVGKGEQAHFWSSTILAFPSQPRLYTASLYHNSDVYSPATDESYYAGASIRCIKQCEPLPPTVDAGADQWDIYATSTQLSGSNPGIGTGKWKIIRGKGGTFSNDTSPTTNFFGQSGSHYELVWTVSTVCADSADTVNISFVNPSCPGLDTVSYAGQTYHTIQIGDQCWMKENLNVGQMISQSMDQMENDTIEKYCYDDLAANCDTFGGLYQWDEMMQYIEENGTWGICPIGWRLPTDEDWNRLEGNVDNVYGVHDPEWEDSGSRGWDAGGNLKHRTANWNQPNEGASNSSGFSALAGGYASTYNGIFYLKGHSAYFWTSSKDDYARPWARQIQHNLKTSSKGDVSSSRGLSVRCILDDCTPMPSQAVAGPDALDQDVDTVQLQADSVLSGTGVWSIVAGTGGSFSDTTKHNAVFQGVPGLSYILRWTVSTPCRLSTDDVEISFTSSTSHPSCPGTPTVNYGGQTYNTVLIGSQCWLKENLNVGSMINSSSSQSNNSSIEKWCYGDNPANCAVYGGLYQWNEAVQYSGSPGVQGLCPSGWHIPTSTEWDALLTELGGRYEAGGKMKESGYTHWNTPNTAATNDSYFTALGSGLYLGSMQNLNEETRFWSSSTYFSYYVRTYALNHDNDDVDNDIGSKNNGLSIRCIKD